MSFTHCFMEPALIFVAHISKLRSEVHVSEGTGPELLHLGGVMGCFLALLSFPVEAGCIY